MSSTVKLTFHKGFSYNRETIRTELRRLFLRRLLQICQVGFFYWYIQSPQDCWLTVLVGNEIEKTCLKIHGWALYNTLRKGLWNTNGLFKTYLWTHLHLQTFKASIPLILIRTSGLLSDQDSHNAKADISTRKAFLQASRCRWHLCIPRSHSGL